MDIDILYITANIFQKKGKLYYYNEEKQNSIKINKRNWNKYLIENGWTKLDWGWRRRLNEHSNEKNNSKYGLLDCGANGDCLFHVISEYLNTENILECNYDIKTLRDIAADEITEENFIIILETYKLEMENIEFIGDWDPYKVNNISDLQTEIKKIGNNFWGDHIILQLLQKKLKFNVIILNSEKLDENMEKYKNIDLDSKFKIHPTASDINEFDKTIIMYYTDGLHFELVGYFDGDKMVSLFKKDQIPSELLTIYNIDCHNLK